MGSGAVPGSAKPPGGGQAARANILFRRSGAGVVPGAALGPGKINDAEWDGESHKSNHLRCTTPRRRALRGA